MQMVVLLRKGCLISPEDDIKTKEEQSPKVNYRDDKLNAVRPQGMYPFSDVSYGFSECFSSLLLPHLSPYQQLGGHQYMLLCAR